MIEVYFDFELNSTELVGWFFQLRNNSNIDDSYRNANSTLILQIMILIHASNFRKVSWNLWDSRLRITWNGFHMLRKFQDLKDSAKLALGKMMNRRQPTRTFVEPERNGVRHVAPKPMPCLTSFQIDSFWVRRIEFRITNSPIKEFRHSVQHHRPSNFNLKSLDSKLWMVTFSKVKQFSHWKAGISD